MSLGDIRLAVVGCKQVVFDLAHMEKVLHHKICKKMLEEDREKKLEEKASHLHFSVFVHNQPTTIIVCMSSLDQNVVEYIVGKVFYYGNIR